MDWMLIILNACGRAATMIVLGVALIWWGRRG
jgi:hypothetical protein